MWSTKCESYFACSLALMIGYIFVMLRPFLAETVNETRRVAELLSQLPAEVGAWCQQML
jgi:hypothetical protein